MKIMVEDNIHSVIEDAQLSGCSLTKNSHKKRFPRKGVIIQANTLDKSLFADTSLRVTSSAQLRPKMPNVINLVKKFVSNSMRGISPSHLSACVQSAYMALQRQQETGLHQSDAWSREHPLIILFGLIRMVTTICFVFTTSTRAVLEVNYPFITLGYLGVLLLEILVMKLNTRRQVQGGVLLLKKDKLWRKYISEDLWCDILIIILIGCDYFGVNTHLFKLVCFVKLLDVFQTIDQFELLIASSKIRTTLWELIKNVSFNLLIAHLISLLLMAMSSLSEHGWIVQKGLSAQSWSEIYCWTFYWACTTMLTIGYGDLAATNSTEALLLSFIELIAIIVLAYTLNNIGDLIRKFRYQDEKMNNQLKLIHQFFKQKELPLDLEMRVRSSIKNKADLNKNYLIKEEDAILETLPKQLRNTILVKTNKPKIETLVFFNTLIKKSLQTISASLERRVYGNHETLVPKNQVQKELHFLVSGKVTKFAVMKRNELKVGDYICGSKRGYVVIGLHDFMRQTQCLVASRSIGNSVVHTISKDTLVDILKNHSVNYESYCYMKDRLIFDSNDSHHQACPHCLNAYHDLSGCAKFHYMPLRYFVVKTSKRNIIRPAYRQKNYQRKLQRTKFVLDTKTSRCFENDRDIFLDSSTNNSLLFNNSVIDRKKVQLRNLAGVLSPKGELPALKIVNRQLEIISLEKQELFVVQGTIIDAVEDFTTYYPSWNASRLFLHRSCQKTMIG